MLTYQTTQKTFVCLQDVLNTSLKFFLRHVFKMSSRHAWKTSRRPTKYLPGRNIYLYRTNLNLQLAILYLANVYLRQIQGNYALIRTQ